MKGTVFNIQKFSLHDGPGIRTTVFMKGCPLRCIWCHNPEARTDIAEGMEVRAREYTEEELMDEILKDAPFYEESGGGVTFSGGEPLTQCKFLISMLEHCRKAGIRTAVDTSGYANKSVFRSLLGKADLYLYDIKLMDPALHLKYTGVSNFEIHENLEYLLGKNESVRLRFPLIPGITNTDDNLRKLTGFVCSLKSRPVVDLLPFHKTAEAKYRRLGLKYKMGSLREPDVAEISKVRDKMASSGIEVNFNN